MRAALMNDRNKYSFFVSAAKNRVFNRLPYFFENCGKIEGSRKLPIYFKKYALLFISMRTAADVQPATVAAHPVSDRQGEPQITEMKTDDYTKRNKTAAKGFTGSTVKDRSPDG